MSEQANQEKTKEWESISKAIDILGISRDDLMARIQNGRIPFRKNGTRYTVNIKLARAFLCKEDVENMKSVQKSIGIQPMSKQKVTQGINNKIQPKHESKVRKVVV